MSKWDGWELVGKKTIEATVVGEEKPTVTVQKKPLSPYLILGAIGAIMVGLYVFSRSEQ